MDDNQRDELLVRIDERVARMDKAIWGNGQPGALDNIARLDERTEQLEKELKERAPSKLERFGIGGAVGGLILAYIAKVLGVQLPV